MLGADEPVHDEPVHDEPVHDEPVHDGAGSEGIIDDQYACHCQPSKKRNNSGIKLGGQLPP